MLVLSDKSLIAPPKLTAWIETVAAEIGVPLQADMFSNGGTDGGAVHLTAPRAHGGDGASDAPRTLCGIDCRLPRHFADAATFICPYSTSYP